MTYFFIDCSQTKLSTWVAWFFGGMAGTQKNFHHKISHFLPTCLAGANYPVACGPCCLFPASFWEKKLKENHGSRSFGNSLSSDPSRRQVSQISLQKCLSFPLNEEGRSSGLSFGSLGLVTKWMQRDEKPQQGGWAYLHISITTWQALPLRWGTIRASTSPDQVVSTGQVFLHLPLNLTCVKTFSNSVWHENTKGLSIRMPCQGLGWRAAHKPKAGVPLSCALRAVRALMASVHVAP